jgi:hypothetical protein
MDHPDIIFYISNLLDSKSLSQFKPNHLIADISHKVYHHRTSQQHVETMLTYEQFYYCYKFEHDIRCNNYKNLKIKGFEPINSFFVEYSNQFLKLTIFTTQLEIISKIPMTNVILDNIIKQFKLPTVTLQWERIKMTKKYDSLIQKRWIYKRYDKHYSNDYNRNCKVILCRKNLMIETDNYDYILKVCKKLL